jgi:tRNA (guanine37-N1)-methyltransferase
LDSLIVESFHTSNSCHMVEYPQYTRPETFSPIPGVEWKVPSVLLSGDHQKIEEWRRQQF